MMLPTFEVEIDAAGTIRPLEPIGRLPPARALVTLLDVIPSDAHLLVEAALADDWLRPEEDEAWAHLQPVKQSF